MATMHWDVMWSYVANANTLCTSRIEYTLTTLCDNCDIQATQERCFETTHASLIICMPSNKINHPLKDIANDTVTTTRVGLLYLFSALVDLQTALTS